MSSSNRSDRENTRVQVRKSIRFEVFKRDSFTCQYCGAKAPEAVLHVDHINPVSNGGDNEIINLVTACQGCNLGKSDRLLDDSSALIRQREEIERLSERREQLEMMLRWRDEARAADDRIAEVIEDAILENIDGRSITDSGRKLIKRWAKKFCLNDILDAVELAADKLPDPKNRTDESYHKLFDNIPKICTFRNKPQDEQRLYYARGILRNRVSYCNDWKAIELLRAAAEAGADVEDLVEITKEVRNWTEFRAAMVEIINNG